MTRNDPPEPDKRTIAAYNRMMERVKSALDTAEKNTLMNLRQGVEKAAGIAEQLGELTRDEAERIGTYLQRDLHDAGKYLAESGNDMRSWLRFDIELIEDRLLDLFGSVADRTRLEWLELEQRAHDGPDYHSGEITGPGSLLCKACGQEIHFHATGHIPPCPSCHGSQFVRADNVSSQLP